MGYAYLEKQDIIMTQSCPKHITPFGSTATSSMNDDLQNDDDLSD